MMVSIKQRLKRINLYIVFLLLLNGCKQNTPLLECVLDNFIQYYDINEDQYVIYITENQGWSEDSSVLILRKEKLNDFKLPSNDNVKMSLYKGVKVFRYISAFDSIELKQKNTVNSDLTWNNVRDQFIESKETNDTKVPIIYDPPSVQLIYNYVSKCINPDFLSKKDFKNSVLSKCNCD